MRTMTAGSDTSYEELVAVGYSPERGRLEATVAIKKTSGYAPAAGGYSREYVRFYVDLGAGFRDVGMAAALVEDAEPEVGQPVPARPLVAVVGVPFAPPRDSCLRPRLPRVRAVLSWQVVPPPQAPQFAMARGNRLDGYVRLPARPPRFSDYLAYLAEQRVPLPQWHEPVDDRELSWAPAPPLGLAELIQRYRPSGVPTHRYALPAMVAALHSGVDSTLWATARQFALAGLDWGGTATELFNADGDTSYERLAALGLDANTDSLVATVLVRRECGYNGDPCSAGSQQYVAFWADWGDEGVLDYLGTAPVSVHDFAELPTDGLSYTACLPLDLTTLPASRRGRAARVRAVVSWGTPPSATDPYALPYWGDALDAHVWIRPGAGVAGPALTVLGGVPVPLVDPETGVVRPEAGLRDSGLPPDPAGPQGPVSVCGTGLRYRQLYRLMVRNVSRNGAPTPVTTPFAGIDEAGRPVRITPSADGWTQAVGHASDLPLGEIAGVLGEGLAAVGDTPAAVGALWAVWLETVPPGPVTEYRIRLAAPADRPGAGVAADPQDRVEPAAGVPVIPAQRPAPRVARRAYLVGHEYAVVDRKPRRSAASPVPIETGNRAEIMSETAQ